jgi:3-oxoisoapionate decarboxylase
MRPGIGSFAFGWAVGHAKPPLVAPDLLEFARRHGLRVVQLGDNLPVHEMSGAGLSALATAAAQSGIALELGARGLTEAHLERYLYLCRQVDARVLRFVADAVGYEPSAGALRALLTNAVPALYAAAVTLALENHDRLSARVLRDVVDAVASPRVGICLDTANSLGAGEGLEFVAELLAPVTVNLHVKDVAVTRAPHQMGFTVDGRALGEGRLPLREAIARVAAAGRCHSVIVESWTSPGTDIDATVALERATVERSVATLKGWLA